MKILQIYYKLPFPKKDGGSISQVKMTELMNLGGCTVDILALNQVKQLGHWPKDKVFNNGKVESQIVNNKITVYRKCKALLSNYGLFFDRFYSKSFDQKIREKLTNNTYDIIQIEHLYLGVYIETIRLFSNAKIIYRAQNVEYTLWKSIIKEMKGFKKALLQKEVDKLMKFEGRVLQKVDGIISLSSSDTKHFKSKGCRKAIEVIPIQYESKKHKIDFSQSFKFYSIGSMDWLPNLIGVKKLLDEMAPNDIPGSYHLAGKKMPNTFKKYEGKKIKIEGEIDDVDNFLKDKTVLIVPLWSGGGIKVKILEAFSKGKLVIATSKAVEGMELVNGKHYIEANTTSDFIKAMKKFKSNPNLCISVLENSRIYLAEKYDAKSLSKKLLEFYEKL